MRRVLPPESREHEYKEVIAELTKHRQNQFDVGRLLSQIMERQLYGQYQSFRELVKHELDINDRTAFRLMFAYYVREDLGKSRVTILPNAEAQVRPLARIPDKQAHRRIEVWKLACKLTKNPPPSPPNANTVVQALKLTFKTRPTEGIQTLVRQYRDKLSKADGALKGAALLSDDSEFQAFIEADDERNVKMQKRFVQQMDKMRNILDDQLALLPSLEELNDRLRSFK